MVRSSNYEFLVSEEEMRELWKEYFQQLLNRRPQEDPEQVANEEGVKGD